MKIWPVQDAKARFSELLETCMSEGPQMVSKRGEAKAVLVPIREWERLQETGKLTAYEVLTSDMFFRGEMDIPARGKLRHRQPVEF